MSEQEQHDFIQTQEADYDGLENEQFVGEEEMSYLPGQTTTKQQQQQQHTVKQKTPIGIVKKPIQKQQTVVAQNGQQVVQKKKNPIPPQFLKNRKIGGGQQAGVAKGKPNSAATTKVLPKQSSGPNVGVNRKNKRQWLSCYRITQLTSLVELRPEQSSTKRFKVQFSYFDSQTKKTHNATLRFGKRGVQYVVDGVADHSTALLKQALIRKAGDPFQPNYWALWLLNNPQCKTIPEALTYFRQQHNIY